MQKPMEEGGNAIKIEFFQRFNLENLPNIEFESIYVSADTASKTK